ncbi:hypothetical protein [Sphingobacterium sp.]|uniref:hypothetical protein n=1 Tax=Sphingobacterium sp. TaxID=341027 RepID=UPI0031D9EB16
METKFRKKNLENFETNYVSPRIETKRIEMEYSVAAGSTVVRPAADPSSEWESSEDQTQVIPWD